MLKSVHFLLTYQCNFECDHCFLYCAPDSDGVFTIGKVDSALRQMREMDSMKSACFEGGEPFLYYPLLVESLRRARQFGFSATVVTNGYWAVSEEDAELWLKPMAEIGIHDLSVSDDPIHYPEGQENHAKRAFEVAKKLNIPCGSICIEEPKVIRDEKKWRGEPVVGGDVLFKGRSVDKMLGNLPRRTYSVFDECPHEDLEKPGRVHLDPFGNIHLCQGIVIGNIWKKPLKEIMAEYDPESHPVIGPILKGGPAELARKFNFDITPGFVDHCHLCFEIRRGLLDSYPDCLTPKQVYGVEN